MSAHLESIRLELEYLRALLEDLQKVDAAVGACSDHLLSGMLGLLELLPAIANVEHGAGAVRVAEALGSAMSELRTLAEQSASTVELVYGNVKRLDAEATALLEDGAR